MPAYVLKNSKKDVGPWVVEIAEHQIETFVNAWAGEGWSLDKKADPSAVALDAATPNQEA